MTKKHQAATRQKTAKATSGAESKVDTAMDQSAPVEVGGPKGPEPTRFGDWERNGRCSDF